MKKDIENVLPNNLEQFTHPEKDGASLEDQRLFNSVRRRVDEDNVSANDLDILVAEEGTEQYSSKKGILSTLCCCFYSDCCLEDEDEEIKYTCMDPEAELVEKFKAIGLF
ncbi:hypothetical protein WR25_13842 [Diploscapter pachys]|uniref:Uncharacterized protein n=1 Tax=Diploscapter pachys TaxID=2018661 RepID=A0A2A2KYB7_9BILA|nr:hypothetical protein WR25_13842 [Diploscapter pachys]